MYIEQGKPILTCLRFQVSKLLLFDIKKTNQNLNLIYFFRSSIFNKLQTLDLGNNEEYTGKNEAEFSVFLEVAAVYIRQICKADERKLEITFVALDYYSNIAC